jgi:DNA replication protein DnaC
MPVKKCDCGETFESQFVGKLLAGISLPEICPICCEKEEKIQMSLYKAVESKKRLERFSDFVFTNIPRRFVDAKISDFQLPSDIKKWIDRPSEFSYVYGDCGIGKSRFACAVSIDLRNRGRKCEIEFASEIAISLRTSFNGNGSESKIIERLSSAEIAIFDDLASQKISEYAIESWYMIIDKRYRECLPTLFTGNLSLPDMSKSMTDRVASRIASGIVWRMPGSDKRIERN